MVDAPLSVKTAALKRTTIRIRTVRKVTNPKIVPNPLRPTSSSGGSEAILDM
jgi:hypothetical protein